MRIQRLYLPGQYRTGDKVSLDKTGSHHIVKVLRYRVDDRLIVFNGEGLSFGCTVVNTDPKAAIIRIDEELNEHTESNLHIHIGLAISKGERMDFAIQKAVEAGVSEITPLYSENSVVRLDDKRRQTRLQHWQGIIRHACEQSGRNHIPVLNPIRNFPQVLSTNSPAVKVILDPSAERGFTGLETRPESIFILIGPEGGFSNDELRQAGDNDFIPVKLGPRILRAETASIAAVISLQVLWGDLG